MTGAKYEEIDNIEERCLNYRTALTRLQNSGVTFKARYEGDGYTVRPFPEIEIFSDPASFEDCASLCEPSELDVSTVSLGAGDDINAALETALDQILDGHTIRFADQMILVETLLSNVTQEIDFYQEEIQDSLGVHGGIAIVAFALGALFFVLLFWSLRYINL